jgi:hypothetical protein
MHAHRYYGWQGPQRPPFGRGWRRGRWEHRGPGRFLPYLAAALLLRAALREAFGRRGGPYRRGPWGWDEPGRGRWGEGAPWRHGHRHHHHEHHHGDQGRGLRPEVMALAGLLRGAFRDGKLDGRKVDEIRTVLGDAQKRIAAILGESGPRPTEL